MIITRHGGSSHYVRPDAVYKTGVIQSIVGYSPQQDVMDVAAAFTQGPYAFQQGSMPVSSAPPGVSGPRVTLMGPVQFLGFGAVQNYGLLQRGWLKLKAWFSSRNAAAFQTATNVQQANPTIAPVQVAQNPYLQYGPSFPGLPVDPRGMQGLRGIIPYGPKQWAGQQVVPSNAGRVGMLIAMQEKNQPAEIAQSNSDAIQQRWDYLRSPVR